MDKYYVIKSHGKVVDVGRGKHDKSDKDQQYQEVSIGKAIDYSMELLEKMLQQ